MGLINVIAFLRGRFNKGNPIPPICHHRVHLQNPFGLPDCKPCQLPM